MRFLVRKCGFLMAMLAALALGMLAGCCGNPGVFNQVGSSMNAVQTFYVPLVGQFLEDETNDQVRAAVVAADTALLIAGGLQQQFCPAPQQAGQLALQAQQAKDLAARAGVK